KGEFYITDLVEMAISQNKGVEALVLEDPAEGLGINTRVDLADCERAMRARVNRQWMLAGVSFLDPDTTTVEMDVRIGQDTILYPNTHLRGKTMIGANCAIGPDSTLVNTSVGDHTVIRYSVAENAVVGSHVSMGPFCHLRSGAVLKDHVHLGNFGEVKDSTLGENTRMGHFSYIGDAKIGRDVNIGAGTITCNYDGKTKNPTEIGDETFIGSDTMLVAPLKIGKRAKTSAGAVVIHDVPDDTLVIGVPAKPKQRKDHCE
ncbi:MAG: bifunctional N-acetylglucosamine-1-phosphate uridyltransferase/glucosamine-1-phosphate acetyltransferase, partial [Anaerolineaceae bacterium]|nr:bifunctional N-acetylglucosamine-1-phosphate uridyltransferase/glucosamine-1-phosphate acetyltransferase [Anaerolineaceae bacterium]